MSRVLILLSVLLFLPLSAMAGVLEDVRERGTLRIGVSTFVPWTFYDRDGNLAGFEIEIGRQIAKDIGVDAEFVEVPFEEIKQRLNAGEFDMIAAGMAITPERALIVNYSNPYFESGITIATNTAATAEIDSLEALRASDVEVAVVLDTLAASLAQRLFTEGNINVFPTGEAARAAVLSGESAVYVTNVPEATFFTLRHPDVVDLPLPEPIIRSVAGFGVVKGEHDWLAYLNAWIAARKADLWLDSTHAHWFGSMDWADSVPEDAQ